MGVFGGGFARFAHGFDPYLGLNRLRFEFWRGVWEVVWGADLADAGSVVRHSTRLKETNGERDFRRQRDPDQGFDRRCSGHRDPPHALGEKDKILTFDRVLLVGDPEKDAAAKVGTPYVYGATATAEVMDQIKGDKIDVVKFKRKKGCRVKQGHR